MRIKNSFQRTLLENYLRKRTPSAPSTSAPAIAYVNGQFVKGVMEKVNKKK